MKRSVIKKTIKKQLKKLQEVYASMQLTYSIEAIHNFRVSVKHLRAFTRMIKSGDKKHSSIPKKLKNVYHHTGVVRNWQLFMQTFSRNRSLKRYALRNLDIALASLRQSMTRDLVRKAAKKLLSRIRGKVEKKQVLAFRHNTLQDIDRLAHRKISNEDDLHAIRKNLKDLQYDKLAGHTGAEKRYYKRLTEKIGALQDCRIELQLLQEINHQHSSARMQRMLNKKIRNKNRLLNDVRTDLTIPVG